MSWIFGYGSLLWKVDFSYSDKIIGFIDGYKRRFWQLSTDHRGVPDMPGRVATIVPDPDGLVWGVAYKIPIENIENVTNHLDHREKGGYTKVTVIFHPREEGLDSFPIMLYIGTADNPLYKPAEDNEIATVINQSRGPSGENTEYLFNLAEFVRLYIPEDNDNHLFGIESLVKQIKQA